VLAGEGRHMDGSSCVGLSLHLGLGQGLNLGLGHCSRTSLLLCH